MAAVNLSTVNLPDRWHSGELKMQQLVHVPESVQSSSSIFRPHLTPQMQDFVPGLRYMFLGTLDRHGRPWVSMVPGDPGFMHSPNLRTLEIKTKVAVRKGVVDPILSNLSDSETFKGGKMMWSGVALDFSNRRRNKMNGTLVRENIIAADKETGDLHLKLTVELSLGNCPKYITLRDVEPLSQEKEHNEQATKGSEPSTATGSILSKEAIGVIEQADCLFIASRFIDESLADQTSGMDCNHRGGNPGFARIEGNVLIFPDYSGNRFFNTLGNIVNDPRVGIMFVAFDKGDILHLTGKATVLIGEDAQAAYPRAQRAVRVVIEDSVFIKGSLPFRMLTKELSPYNPAVPTHQHGIAHAEKEKPLAKLIDITRHTDGVATFTFRTSKPFHSIPGQYAVLDFSRFNTTGYQHMSASNPQSLNDDYIRTWTISSAPDSHGQDASQGFEWKDTSEFSITVKRKPGGTISTLLHDLPESALHRLVVPFVSAEGDFSLSLLNPMTTPKIGFISAGIGSTPFISMLRGIQKLPAWALDIQWITTARRYEDTLPSVLQELTAVNSTTDSNLKIHAVLTQPGGQPLSLDNKDQNPISVYGGGHRLNQERLLSMVPDLQERHVFLCGPPLFMDSIKSILIDLGLSATQVHTEEFNF